MSTLLSNSTILAITDDAGATYALLLPGIDQANAKAQVIMNDLGVGLGSDYSHLAALAPYVQGIYELLGTSGVVSNSFAIGGASVATLSAGRGLLNRTSIMNSSFFAFMEGFRADIERYGTTLSVIDFSSFAAYQNTLSPFSCLYSPSFAAAFWYAYNQAQQLASAAVFAPSGINLGSYVITAADTGTLTAGALPTANGYALPAPTTDEYGNSVYVGGLPMAQGFAPVLTQQVKVTTAINGTCALTVTALNQVGVAHEWTATLDNLALGATVNLTAVTGGDRMGGASTAMAVSGTATAGAFEILTVEDRAY